MENDLWKLTFIAIPLILFFGVMIYVYAGIWLDGMKLRWELRKKDRVINLRQAKELIRGNKGMIIVDAPTLGWNINRVWWSPTTDFIPRTDSSHGINMMCPKEDILNYYKFIENTTGTAKLIDSFVITQRTHSYLKKHFVIAKYGFIFTAGVLFDKDIKNKQTESNGSKNSDDNVD